MATNWHVVVDDKGRPCAVYAWTPDEAEVVQGGKTFTFVPIVLKHGLQQKVKARSGYIAEGVWKQQNGLRVG